MHLFLGVFFGLFVTTPAHAQDMMSFLGAGANTPNISFDDTFFGNADATDGNSSNLNDENFYGSVPLYEEARDLFYATVREQQIQLSGQLTIPEQSYSVPRGFGRADFGLGWLHGDAVSGHTGVTASIGTSGPVAFNGYPEISATYFAEWIRWNGDAWIFILSYSFMFVNWRPMPFVFNASLNPFSASTDATLVLGPIQPYTGFSWAPKSYLNMYNPDSTVRFFYEKLEWSIGLKIAFGRSSTFSLGYVYDFDRYFALGDSLTQPLPGTVGLADASGIQAKLRVTF